VPPDFGGTACGQQGRRDQSVGSARVALPLRESTHRKLLRRYPTNVVCGIARGQVMREASFATVLKQDDSLGELAQRRRWLLASLLVFQQSPDFGPEHHELLQVGGLLKIADCPQLVDTIPVAGRVR
jgi:hypothetical protein